MKKFSKEKLHLPKIDGITLRWLINIIGVIVVFFIIVFIISAFSIKNTYYSNVESILNSGASSTAVSYFSANLDAGNTLEQSAAEYIDSYSYKEKTTTWIIDIDGNVVVSSSGFAIEKQDMPDYTQALENDNNDYLSFSLKRKDGTVIPVLDHGRLINSRYYGNIFYVFIIDHDLVRKCLN